MANSATVVLQLIHYFAHQNLISLVLSYSQSKAAYVLVYQRQGTVVSPQKKQPSATITQADKDVHSDNEDMMEVN